MSQDAFWGIAATVIGGLLASAIINLITRSKKQKSKNNILTLSLFTASLAGFVLSLLLNQVLYHTAADDKEVVTVAEAAMDVHSDTPTPDETFVAAKDIPDADDQASETKQIQITETPTETITPTQPLESTSKAKEVIVKVTDPQDGDHVQKTARISGTVDGELTDDTFLWVVVNPDTSPNQYWPQEKAILADENGIWRCTVVLGDDESKGHTFYIRIISVNGDDNQYYIDYLNGCRESGIYPGIPLPSSTETFYKVAVVRD